jgi:uncharacterized MAPEG superfamily protein
LCYHSKNARRKVQAASLAGRTPISQRHCEEETHDDRSQVSGMDCDSDRGVVDSLHRVPSYDQRAANGGELPGPNTTASAALGARANRAHLNAVEVFAPFAALVVIGHLIGKAEAIGIWAMAFFWIRVIHAVIFWVGAPLLRTIAFTLGFIVECVIFWIVIT